MELTIKDMTIEGEADTLFSVYKLSVFWDSWSSQIQNRILRDLMMMERLAVVQHTQLVVACDLVLQPYLEVCGIKFTNDFGAPDLVRVYVADKTNVPDEVYKRLPPNIPFDLVPLLTKETPVLDGNLRRGNYTNVPLKGDWIRIQPTLDINKQVPYDGVTDADGLFAPFF